MDSPRRRSGEFIFLVRPVCAHGKVAYYGRRYEYEYNYAKVDPLRTVASQEVNFARAFEIIGFHSKCC